MLQCEAGLPLAAVDALNREALPGGCMNKSSWYKTQPLTYMLICCQRKLKGGWRWAVVLLHFLTPVFGSGGA